jgi:5'(3')-deoxyribonucleotidase
MGSKPILFIDMDNVIADFSNSSNLKHHDELFHSPPEMFEEGFFENLPVVEGALWALRVLQKKYDIHILTKPVAITHYSHSEKSAWIWKWFPYLGNKVHMSQNKEFLSAPNRILIDDSQREWSDKWVANGGKFVHFKYHPRMRKEYYKNLWVNIVEDLMSKGDY